MPFGTIQLNPGVNTIMTPTLNQAGVSNSNLIRYRGGLIEKMGGWLQYINTAMDSVTRALHAWKDNNGNEWLAVANLSSFDVINGASLTNLTPQSLVTDPSVNFSTIAGSTVVTIVDTDVAVMTLYDSVFFNTPVSVGGIVLAGLYQILPGGIATEYEINAGLPATATVNTGGAVPEFSTTAGSPIVQITLNNHGLVPGAEFYLPIPTAVGGLVVSGVVAVSTVIDNNNFTIIGNTNATTTISDLPMNGGNAEFLYYISVAPFGAIGGGSMGPIATFAVASDVGSGLAPANQTGNPITATDWTLDNWGAFILACATGGPIYYWNPASGFTTLTAIGSGPPQSNGIFVAMPEQILVAWGSASSLLPNDTDVASNALTVRWSNILDFTNWVVSTETQAGSFQIPTGSEIRGGIQSPNSALILTDIDVWAMNYIGYPLVFGFNKIYSSDGLVGKHAICNMRGSTFWMGNNNFYMFGANGVSIIPCTVWDYVFQDLDTAHQGKCVAAPNSEFSEIIFFFPSLSGGTGENDKYVKVNVVEGFAWDLGIMARSAWEGFSILGSPIAADPNTLLLQQHETGYSDNGNPMNSFFTTGAFAYGDGENFSVIDQFEPDMKYTTVNSSLIPATPTVTINTVNYPSDTVSMTSTTVMTSTTEYLTPRVRGRQATWSVGTNDATSWWRQGKVRYRFSVDGRR